MRGVLLVRSQRERHLRQGIIGGGALTGGSLDDEDYLAGQIKFSDTFSKLDGDSLVYGTIDLGQRFVLLDRSAHVTVSPDRLLFLAGERSRLRRKM
jgi:hypothetical protein